MAYNYSLDFEPTEEPAWRKRLPKVNAEPSIPKMIQEIIEYKRSYKELKQKKKIKKDAMKKTEFDFLLTFLFNLQSEEGIGLEDKGDTEEVVSELEKDYPQTNYEKLEEIISPSTRGQKRKHSGDASSSQDSNVSGEDEECKRQTTGSFDPPYFPSLGDTEEEITTTYDTVSHSGKPYKNLRETINLYKAYKHLAKQIDKIEKEERNLYLGFIDVDTCILESHAILMDKINENQEIDKREESKLESVKPTHFSTNKRSACFRGETHYYPQFASEELADTAVQKLVDIYSDIFEEIRKIPDSPEHEEEKTSKSFKCASLFLFGFLSLHPFGDGNGRLARLLCGYSLFSFCPFLTPIFNVFSPSKNDDYVDALLTARRGLKLPDVITTKDEAIGAALAVIRQKPCDLCALVIESNRYMWRQYLFSLKNIPEAGCD